MQRQLYPAQLAPDTVESLLAERSTRGHALYVAVLTMLLAALALLPVVHVPVSVQAPGIVRPVIEKHEVQASVAGFVERVMAAEGDRVQRGDPLIRLGAAPLEARETLLLSRLREATSDLRDLERLTRAASPASIPLGELASPVHRQALSRLLDELDAAGVREVEATRALDRARALAGRDLLPRAEVERAETALAGVLLERDLAVERALAQWEASLAAIRERLAELEAERVALRAESALYRVDAPVAGTVEELPALSPGSWVQPGQRLAVLSPAADLEAEVYAAPSDVGLLAVGAPVRLLIDAFPYVDWGFLSGRVASLSDDYLLMDGKPVFRVAVRLDRTVLTLPSGARGHLRKGMTLRARFLVAERSLWQLLRDDVNDWIGTSDSGLGTR